MPQVIIIWLTTSKRIPFAFSQGAIKFSGAISNIKWLIQNLQKAVPQTRIQVLTISVLYKAKAKG